MLESFIKKLTKTMMIMTRNIPSSYQSSVTFKMCLFILLIFVSLNKGTVRNLETDPSGTCSKKAKLLFYYLKQQLLDSVPVFLEKRSFLLGRFLIWKMKRWYTLYKRTIMENKKINLFVNQFLEKQVCRICDEKVSLKNFKFHSQYCK